ncbi:Putative arsenical resistance operon repressor ArsR [uncultured archaeon]|nr:Putative arsenical resistance operon repressor ArsR [uncultured archaeon]
MLDKELPMLSRKRAPITTSGGENESCRDNSACCEAERTLAKLYGNQSVARERCLHVCTQAKKIDEEDLTTEIKVFKAVADATRLKILKLLTAGELCICEIMLALKKPQSSISHNLSILEDVGLIKERKEGKWCLYRISDGTVMDMVNLAGQRKRK